MIPVVAKLLCLLGRHPWERFGALSLFCPRCKATRQR